MEVGFSRFKIMKYRLYLVLIINVLILSWLIYLGYTADVTDVLGLFQFIVFIFLFIFDIYFLVINKLFFKNTQKNNYRSHFHRAAFTSVLSIMVFNFLK